MHFIRTEIDLTDFKKENLATKIRRNKNIRKPYKKRLIQIIQIKMKQYKFQMILQC